MTALILSIFLIPLVIIINSFLLGKLVQRYSVSVNPYLATVIGFFIYIAIFFVFFSLLYVSAAIITVYLIFFITIQVLLLSLYLWNWRHTFTTFQFKWKTLLFFITTLLLAVGLLVIIILLAYHTTAKSLEMENIINNFQNNFNKYTNVVALYENKFSFENFSIFVVFAAILRPVFKIADNQINNYLFWQQVITFGVIFSCVTTGFFYQRINNSRVLLQPFLLTIIISILIFSFMFYETPIIGYSWISVPVILYCYQTFRFNRRDDRLSNNILLIIVIGLTALSVDLTLITILLLLFNFCYTSMKNLNPFGQTLYCFFPFLYVFFLWMPLSSSVPYVVLLTLWLIASLIMFLLYSRNIFRKAIMNVNKLAYRHPLFIIILISVIIYTLSLFFLITIFNYHFSWQLWPENYHYIWGLELINKYPNFNFYFNIGAWIAITIILIITISISLVRKIKFNEQPYLFLILLMILLFINPFSLNIFLKISDQNHFVLLDLGLINFLVIVPLTLWLSETVSEKKMFRMERRMNG